MQTPEGTPVSGDQEGLVLGWAELDALVERLAAEIAARCADEGLPDLMLAVTRGGLVPAGMLAYRLDLRAILVAGVELYRPDGGTHAAPVVSHFPDDALLAGRRVLVVDEVWETGETMAEILRRVSAAGATPFAAVLHYKPGRSHVAGVPDCYAALADGWVTYPYKAGR